MSARTTTRKRGGGSGRAPAYEILFRYTRGGAGVGIALFRYRAFDLFGPDRDSTMAFMRDGSALLTAEGAPHAGLDSGYHADAWHSVRELAYEDSPEDGTIADGLEDEYPGLLEQAQGVLRAARSQRLSLLDRKPIRVPKRRENAGDVARAAELVRAFLGLRGQDEAGHRVISHQGASFPFYVGTVVYEGRAWTEAFQEFYDELAEDDEPCVEALSSYEVGVLS